MHRASGINFKNYKRNTLLRRLEKRMTINNVSHLSDYLEVIKKDKKENEALRKDFLIGVTSFFRDVDAFQAIKEKVVPNLFKGKTEADLVRVWVAGCSTGEEVYSIAMLLDEFRRASRINVDFKIFTTDIDSLSIAVASAAVYSENVVSELPQNYLDQYFLKAGDHKLEVIKRIREKIVFSNHNLLKDPPFIRMDLISCRNLLIYLENREQIKILQNMHFALNKHAYLFLGNSESLGTISQYFKVLDTKWKIFQSTTTTKYVPNGDTTNENPKFNLNYRAGYKTSLRNVTYKSNPENEFYKFLSSKFAPDCIFFDREYNILYLNGDAGKKLTLQQGLFHNSLLKMVSPDIATTIRNSVKRLKTENKDVIVKGIVNKQGEETYVFNLTFSQLEDQNSFDGEVFVLLFGKEQKRDEEAIEIRNTQLDDASKQLIDELETELKTSKAELQNVVEELETSNEELQSSNEELMASNEELQSTNEELQSVNEELYTVNSELQEKNKELARLNNDMTNLLNSTEIGTLFLDIDLRVRKFTPALQKHFKLQENDIGRPIASFASNFDERTRKAIIADSKKALNDLVNIESEIFDDQGGHFIKRVSPFITADKKIDGVVITFVEITRLRKAEKELSEIESKYKQLFSNLNESFFHARIITDKDGKAIDWEYKDVNPAFEKLSGYSKDDIIGKKVSELLPQTLNDPANWLQKYADTALKGQEQFIRELDQALGKYVMVHAFSPKNGEFAATVADLTEMKESEEELLLTNHRLELSAEITGLALWEYDIKSDKIVGNKKWGDIFGFDGNNASKSFRSQMNAKEATLTKEKLNQYIEGKADKYADSFSYTNPKTNKKYFLTNVAKIIEQDDKGAPSRILGGYLR